MSVFKSYLVSKNIQGDITSARHRINHAQTKHIVRMPANDQQLFLAKSSSKVESITGTEQRMTELIVRIAVAN